MHYHDVHHTPTQKTYADISLPPPSRNILQEPQQKRLIDWTLRLARSTHNRTQRRTSSNWLAVQLLQARYTRPRLADTRDATPAREICGRTGATSLLQWADGADEAGHRGLWCGRVRRPAEGEWAVRLSDWGTVRRLR